MLFCEGDMIMYKYWATRFNVFGFLISSLQLPHGCPRFRISWRFPFNTLFGVLRSGILCVCPYDYRVLPYSRFWSAVLPLFANSNFCCFLLSVCFFFDLPHFPAVCYYAFHDGVVHPFFIVFCNDFVR